jgi:hypothetical protein
MLSELLIRDEMTASLGKTEHTFIIHISGEAISQRVTQQVEEFNSRKPESFRRRIQLNQTETSVTFLKLGPLVGR